MNNQSTHTWHGSTGNIYRYEIHPLHPLFIPSTHGNYVFAKLSPQGLWLAVYVGQGHLQERHAAAIREGCVLQKYATHFHYHANALDTRR